MGLFHEVKCGKCDRRYSSIRSKCPYCGARRNQGKHSPASGGVQAQQIIGIVVLIIIIIAVVVLVASSLKNKDNDNEAENSSSPGIGDSQGVDSVTGDNPQNSIEPTDDSAAPSESVTPTSTVKIDSIKLNRDDFTLTEIGVQWDLEPEISPSDADVIITWTSSDPSVATVSEHGVVTSVNKGTATVTATVGDVKAECIVRVTAAASGSSSSNSSTEDSSSTSGTAKLSHSDVTIHASSSESFTLSVSGTTDRASFSSSNAGVATVDAGGKVTAVSAGTATITVTVGSSKLICTVRVV